MSNLKKLGRDTRIKLRILRRVHLFGALLGLLICPPIGLFFTASTLIINKMLKDECRETEQRDEL